MKELHKTPKTLVLLFNTPEFQCYKNKFTNNIGPQLKHIDNLMRYKIENECQNWSLSQGLTHKTFLSSIQLSQFNLHLIPISIWHMNLAPLKLLGFLITRCHNSALQCMQLEYRNLWVIGRYSFPKNCQPSLIICIDYLGEEGADTLKKKGIRIKKRRYLMRLNYIITPTYKTHRPI